MVDQSEGDRELGKVFDKGFGSINGIQDPYPIFLQSDGVVR